MVQLLLVVSILNCQAGAAKLSNSQEHSWTKKKCDECSFLQLTPLLWASPDYACIAVDEYPQDLELAPSSLVATAPSIE